MKTDRPALFAPRRDKLQAVGQALARKYPVDPNTPSDMLELLEKLR